MWSSLLPFLGGIISNIVNSGSVRKNNAANIQLARERNAQQRAESELAYQRSKPTTQVNNLMAAGMSKAGALSTLNGGGSYTPAAISTAQTQASQVDTAGMFDGIIAAAENSKNRQLQKDLQDRQLSQHRVDIARQLDHAKEIKKMELDSQERIARENRESTENIANNRLLFDREQWESLEKYRSEQYRQLKISNDLQDRLSDITYEQAVENVGLTKAQKFLTYTQESKLYEELQDFLDAEESREVQRATDIAENVVKQLCAATDFQYKYLEYSYINSLEGKEREEAILRAESWWRLVETRFGGVAQVIGKVAMALGLIYFGKGAGMQWMQKLGAPKYRPVGFS